MSHSYESILFLCPGLMLKFQSEGFQLNVLGTCMTTLVVANPNTLGRMNVWDTFVHDQTCVN